MHFSFTALPHIVTLSQMDELVFKTLFLHDPKYPVYCEFLFVLCMNFNLLLFVLCKINLELLLFVLCINMRQFINNHVLTI
jgi:hypothetical protein